MPHTPTSAQLTQLKVLQDAQAEANATLNRAEASVAAARALLAEALAAKQAADDAVVAYQSFIFGGYHLGRPTRWMKGALRTPSDLLSNPEPILGYDLHFRK